VFTDLLLLKSGLNMDDPVTKYLPELEGESVIQWEDVTLGALGDHLSGMPVTCKFSSSHPNFQKPSRKDQC
jgi:CubicO group peptidase (beta-lactamase class C family)